MTLLTTHIAVESLAVWFLMGKKNREIFKKRIGLFAGLTLFAALPDLDAFFYIHRTYMHSIIWPIFIILGVLSYLGYMKWIKKTPPGEKADLICRSIIIASSFLILHSFLDLNPGPVLLFYPFDNRLYRWDVSMVWDLDSIFYIKELKFSWSSISLSEGFERSIFNMRPSERIAYFGSEFIELFIGEFPIHFLTVLAWIVFFPGMALYNWLAKRDKPLNFFKKIRKLRNPLLGLGVVFLCLGLVIGPGFRLNRTETKQSSHLLMFSETNSNFGVYQKYELDAKDSITLHGIFAGNTSSNVIAAVIANEEDFLNLDDSLAEMFELYNNNTGYSYNSLVNDYRNEVQSFQDNSLDSYLITQNITEGLSYTLDKHERLYTLILLQDWNASSDFEVQVQMTSSILIKRVVEFTFGMIFASLGIIILGTNVVLIIRKPENNISSEEIDKSDPNTQA